MEFAPPEKATALLCCLLVSLAVAGCLGGMEASNLAGTETSAPGGTVGTDVSDETAKERALSAEEEFITRQLDTAPCVEGWGLTNYGGIPEDATIENRTVDGVYVEVTHPYWYGTEQDEIDHGTTARYLVTGDNVRRIEGDELSPC